MIVAITYGFAWKCAIWVKEDMPVLLEDKDDEVVLLVACELLEDPVGETIVLLVEEETVVDDVVEAEDEDPVWVWVAVDELVPATDKSGWVDPATNL